MHMKGIVKHGRLLARVAIRFPTDCPTFTFDSVVGTPALVIEPDTEHSVQEHIAINEGSRMITRSVWLHALVCVSLSRKYIGTRMTE
jgi:hypothetical protein